MGSRPAIWLLPIEGAVTIRRRAELMQLPRFALGNHPPQGGGSSLHGHARRRSFCSRCVWLVAWTRSGGERRAVDAVSHWWICCCYCAPTRKDCSLLCAMHETMVVFTCGLFAVALGIWKLLDLSTEWRRVRQCVWRARGARTQDTLIALSGRQYH